MGVGEAPGPWVLHEHLHRPGPRAHGLELALQGGLSSVLGLQAAGRPESRTVQSAPPGHSAVWAPHGGGVHTLPNPLDPQTRTISVPPSPSAGWSDWRGFPPHFHPAAQGAAPAHLTRARLGHLLGLKPTSEPSALRLMMNLITTTDGKQPVDRLRGRAEGRGSPEQLKPCSGPQDLHFNKTQGPREHDLMPQPGESHTDPRLIPYSVLCYVW